MAIYISLIIQFSREESREQRRREGRKRKGRERCRFRWLFPTEARRRPRGFASKGTGAIKGFSGLCRFVRVTRVSLKRQEPNQTGSC